MCPTGLNIRTIFYSLYVNDIFKLCDVHTDLTLYADDTNILLKGVDEEELMEKGNKVFSQVCDWSIRNGLRLNIEKSCFIHFNNKLNKEKDCTIQTSLDIITSNGSNEGINRYTRTKFLGVMIDESLSFEEHINML